MYEPVNNKRTRIFLSPYAQDSFLLCMPKPSHRVRPEFDAETGVNLTPSAQPFRSLLTLLNKQFLGYAKLYPPTEFQDTRPDYQTSLDETDIAFQLASIHQHDNFRLDHPDPTRRPLYFLNFNMDDPDQEPYTIHLTLDVVVKEYIIAIAHHLHIPSMGWELGVSTKFYDAPRRISNTLNAIGIGWATHPALPIKHPRNQERYELS